MELIAGMIIEVLRNVGTETVEKNVRKRAEDLASRFPVP
jgi:glycine/serine hydroxymethyltransferase